MKLVVTKMSDQETSQTVLANSSREISHFNSPPSLLHSGDSLSESSSCCHDEDDVMIDNEGEKPVDSQAELRKRIMDIQTNSALSPSEKAKQVQVY